MQVKTKTKNAALKRIGLWATIWWGVSCAYVLLLVLVARNNYYGAGTPDIPILGTSFAALARWWGSAVRAAFDNSGALQGLLCLIAIVWIAVGWLWLKELRRQNIRYKAAFKDLFLTVRR